MRQIFLKTIQQLFVPVARLCLKHSIHLQDAIECLKRAFLAAAEEQLASTKAKATASRLSVMTGIHRKDIDRLSGTDSPYEGEENLITKVVGHWQTDARFIDKKKRPKVLECSSVNSPFYELVRSVSKELNPATVLFELERTKTVERIGSSVSLVRGSYSPPDKIEHGLKILTEDAADLLLAVEENIDKANHIPNLHARTVFDKIRPEKLDEIRAWLVQEGHQLHLRARQFLSQHDQDISPNPSFKGEGCNVVLSSFSIVKKGED